MSSTTVRRAETSETFGIQNEARAALVRLPECLYAYPGLSVAVTSNGDVGVMSRLPLPATPADDNPDLRATDPGDIDVYVIGASGVQPAEVCAPLGSSLGRLATLSSSEVLLVGEKTAPDSTAHARRGINARVSVHRCKKC